MTTAELVAPELRPQPAPAPRKMSPRARKAMLLADLRGAWRDCQRHIVAIEDEWHRCNALLSLLETVGDGLGKGWLTFEDAAAALGPELMIALNRRTIDGV